MTERKMSKELFAQAVQCKTAQELVDLCAKNNLSITLEEAEKFLAQTKEGEISLNDAEKVAGGEPCVGAVSFGCIGIGIA